MEFCIEDKKKWQIQKTTQYWMIFFNKVGLQTTETFKEFNTFGFKLEF